MNKKLLNELSAPLTAVTLLVLLSEMIPGVGLMNFAPPLLLGAVWLYVYRRRLPPRQWLLSAAVWVVCTVLVYRFSPSVCRFFAEKTAGHHLRFAAVNTVLETLLTPDYGDLFYHRAYSRCILTNQGLVSGAVDIFRVTSSDAVSQYLTGKYIVNLCLPFGLLTLKADKRLLWSLIALSVLAGDSRLLCAVALLYAPALFVCFTAVAALAYYAVAALDIRIGFVGSASVTEFLRYGEQPVFFLLIGAVCAVMLLFVSLYIDGRFAVKKASRE